MERIWHKHVVEGNPVEIDIAEISLPELFMQSVRTYYERPAVTFFDKTYTYGELDSAVQRTASALVKLGIKKNDRVAIMLPNCPQYPIIYFAVLFCGAIVVQVNPMYRENELHHVLSDSGAKVLFLLDRFVPTVQRVLEKIQLSDVITVSLHAPSRMDELLRDPGDRIPDVEISPKEDVAVLQYTGGTTGRSKGVMLTHYNLVANTLQSAATSRVQTVPGEERVLAASPLFHVYGMTSAMNTTFYNGGNMILLPKFDPESAVQAIVTHKPTTFPGVPTMYIGLIHYLKERPADLSSLKICSSGSAPLPLEVLHRFKEITGTSVAEGYGLSEASPVTHRNPVGGLQKPGSIGIPIPNTDCRIVDMETGKRALPVGEVGELIIKGPQVMKGYWNLPEETEQTLRDGWLYTGDLAKMDEDGFFYITGRKKDLIIASGYNVYPVEVENVLYSHPKVLEAAVIGVPDSYRGETVQAVVVLKEDEQLSEKELIDYCRERLAAYKVPRIVTFVEELPKTAVGKILKRKLKEQFSVR